jgi:3-hydroxyisobutyrate dehydrogenase-like beta-hydroxyacid dehydrogenase
MKKIAVVGTGIMGSGIAANYLKAGYQVFVWNRSADKTAKLRQAGAVPSESPKAATEQADIIFEVTANDESSQSVWQGDDGILAGAAKDKTLIASATLSADWTIRLSQLCLEKGFTFLDIPLTGGRVAAENGSLKLLAGGDKAQLETLKPDLEAISSKLFYFGPAGSGMKYKLILNSLQAVHMAGFGEAMRLAKQEGLDVSKVGPALCDRPGGEVTNFAWNAYQKAAMPLTFSVNWITKDLEYAKQMGSQAELPILDDALATYQKARNTGHGDEDWSYIIKPDRPS